MIHTQATLPTTFGRRGFSRFRLRWLLLLFIPASILLTIYSRNELQRRRINNAFDRINKVGFDAHFSENGDCILYSRNANITDGDLKALIPVGSGEAGMGNHKVIRLELRGSKVSDEAMAEFRQAAPECELIQ